MSNDFKKALEKAAKLAEVLHGELKEMSSLVELLDRQINRAINQATKRIRMVETTTRNQKGD